MEQHGFGSHHTVVKALKKLSEFGIIQIIKRRDQKNKRQMVNIYVLTDVQSWKPMAPDATGADGISDTEPMAFQIQKPMAPDATEGNTVGRKHKEGIATPSVAVPVERCKYENEEGIRCREKPIRGREFCKTHQKMSCVEFVEWYRKSEKRYIRIIAEFADEVRPPECDTVAQWEVWAAAHYRAAKKLEPFPDEKIAVGMDRVKTAKYLTSWNLETLFKFMTNAEVKNPI